MSLTTPFTPTSPERPANHPGAPIRISSVGGVSHQGCGGGGGVSFEMSYSDPAKRTGVERTIVANTALATRCNFGFTRRFYYPKRPNPRKINCLLVGYFSLVFSLLSLVRWC